MKSLLHHSPLNDISSVLLDAVFPPRCAGCRVWSDGLFCAPCCASLQPVEPPLCAHCGLPFDPQLQSAQECPDCRANRYQTAPPFEALRSIYRFEGALRHAVHRFKYDSKTALARPLAELLHEFLIQPSTRSAIATDDVQAIVPVPLHPWRRYRRGYNQSELLARELGRLLDVPSRDLLRRTRHTAPQVELTKRRRRENVHDAFAVQDTARVRGATLLLLDDVCTTGATLGACARALKASGASHVFAVTLARQV